MDQSGASKDTIRILCFGDSLTAGYHSWGMEYYPYSTRLEKRLNEEFPAKDYEITVDGVPGDLVTIGSFKSRLEHQLSTNDTFDWVVILGGTNDVGWGRPLEDILTALEILWTMALESGAKVLALTIAANKACENAGYRQKLLHLNEKILNHEDDSYFTADLFELVPWPSEDTDAQDRIWDDGLHFTPVGYDLMGDVVADRLIELLG